MPTAEQPLRAAEFDQLFATALRGLVRTAPDRLELRLDQSVEEAARELTRRESSCCSFFTFDFSSGDGGEVLLKVSVPSAQVAVLGALANRAASMTT